MQIDSPIVSGFAASIESILSSIGINAPSWLGALLGVIVFAIIFSIIFSVAAYVLGWVERKIIGRAQSRHGPTYVGKYGFLQNFADLIKLISKEWFVPDRADSMIFPFMLPIAAGIFVFVLALIPLSPSFVGANVSLGLFAIFVALSFMPLIFFLAGWSSGNKFGSISAQRSVVMMVSYEIPLFIVLASVIMLAGSYNMISIVNAQNPYWFALMMPIGFFVFFVVMLAELERAPFDLREADSELIAGWLTDVSAPYYALALLVDYLRLFIGSLLIVLIFLGGWLPIILTPFLTLFIKVALVSLFIMVVRLTLIRMRIDRIIRTGWMYLAPLALINLLITFILFIR